MYVAKRLQIYPEKFLSINTLFLLDDNCKNLYNYSVVGSPDREEVNILGHFVSFVVAVIANLVTDWLGKRRRK